MNTGGSWDSMSGMLGYFIHSVFRCSASDWVRSLDTQYTDLHHPLRCSHTSHSTTPVPNVFPSPLNTTRSPCLNGPASSNFTSTLTTAPGCTTCGFFFTTSPVLLSSVATSFVTLPRDVEAASQNLDGCRVQVVVTENLGGECVNVWRDGV